MGGQDQSAALLLAHVRLTTYENAHLLVHYDVRRCVDAAYYYLPSIVCLRITQCLLQAWRGRLQLRSRNLSIEPGLLVQCWDGYRMRCLAHHHPLSATLETTGQRSAEGDFGGHLPAAPDSNLLRHSQIGLLQSDNRYGECGEVYVL